MKVCNHTLRATGITTNAKQKNVAAKFAGTAILQLRKNRHDEPQGTARVAGK